MDCPGLLVVVEDKDVVGVCEGSKNMDAFLDMAESNHTYGRWEMGFKPVHDNLQKYFSKLVSKPPLINTSPKCEAYKIYFKLTLTLEVKQPVQNLFTAQYKIYKSFSASVL